MLLYACTIFLSAFLLFQVQPLIAKMILPWFGGSSAVWTACVLFFQLLLLFGYLYAHWTIQYLRPKVQTIVHLALLATSLLALPAIPNPAWKPTGGADPTIRIFELLAVTVGLPYFLLSTTGPLIQAWFVREKAGKGGTPYRLYALSNLGSMLALISYPVLVEPYLATRLQGYGWSAGYALFVVFCGVTSWRSRYGLDQREMIAVNAFTPAVKPQVGMMLVWVGLAACASTLLLAVTNHLSQNVAAIPFLWVLPLALYLLSFILCFDGDGWYKRNFFVGLLAVMLASMAYAQFADVENMPLFVALPLFSVGLFVCCMVCHGELARLKPDPRHLTLFYLMVSIGGAIGGVFVGLIAPNVFSGYYELPIGLAACGVLVLIALRQDLFRDAVWRPEWLLSLAYVMVLIGYVGGELNKSLRHDRVAVRNFYGGLKVSDSGIGREAERTLTHGTINHGEQFLAPERRRLATTYYGPNTGVGLAIRSLDPDKPHRIGVIGLGAGTLATYGRLGAGDRITFYEINPLVIQLARSQFTFLMDSQAQVDIVLGDARLSLERQDPQNYDVLAVDAFSSDSIPVHLLTVEAFRLYFRHLKPDGILTVHISNRYLDLNPIVQLAARTLNKAAKTIDTEDDDSSGVFGATWVLVTSDPHIFDRPELGGVPGPATLRSVRLWTDDYSNLFRILKR